MLLLCKHGMDWNKYYRKMSKVIILIISQAALTIGVLYLKGFFKDVFDVTTVHRKKNMTPYTVYVQAAKNKLFLKGNF